jgi:hypothetical protein
MRREIQGPWVLAAREALFRAACRHRQGPKNNIFLYCMPRSGSTWILNTVAAHPGCRYVGRPFMTLLRSRWRRRVPDLAESAGSGRGHEFFQFIHFEGDAERRFLACARSVAQARWAIYPTMHFRAPYFHRRTDRVIFQVHALCPLIELCDRALPIDTVILLRHPITNALSLLDRHWNDESQDFLRHDWFRRTCLTRCQRRYADRVARRGSPLERHVLDWCLRWLIPMRAWESGQHPGWLTLTYEQTVLEPDTVVDLLSSRLDLPCTDPMRAQVRRPSRTVSGATANRLGDRHYLLSRWRKRLSADEIERAMEIPRVFDLTMYSAGDDLPRPMLWHGPPPAHAVTENLRGHPTPAPQHGCLPV